MGMCASYNETRRYEESAMVQKQPHIDDNSFKQLAFDFNVRTVIAHFIALVVLCVSHPGMQLAKYMSSSE